MNTSLKDLILGSEAPQPLEPLIPELHGVTDTDKTDAILISLIRLAIAFEDAVSDGLTLEDALPLVRPVQATAASCLHWREATEEIPDYTAAEAERLQGRLLELLPQVNADRVRDLSIAAIPLLAPLIGLVRVAARTSETVAKVPDQP